MRRHRTTARRLLRAVLDQYRSLGQLRDRDVLLLAAANLLGTMSVSIVVPLLPTYADQHGAGPFLVGAIFAAPAASRAVLSLPAGYVSDVLGRRRLIVGGALLNGASVLALALAASPTTILALRALDGVGMAMAGPATTAYVGDAVPTEERGQAMGAYQSAGVIGVAVGPGIGGALALGAGYAAPFAVLGAATLAGGLALAVLLRPIEQRPTRAASPDAAEDGDADGTTESDADGTAQPVTDSARAPISLPTRSDVAPFLTPSIVALGASLVVSQLATGATNPLLAPLLAERFVGGPGYVSLAWSCLGLGMVVFTPIGGSVVDSVGRKPPLVASKVGWVGVVVGLLSLESALAPPLLLFVGGSLSGLGAPALGALQYELAPDGREGTLGGVFSGLNSGAQAAGPLLGGAVAAAFGVAAVFVAVAASWTLDALTVAAGVREPEDSGARTGQVGATAGADPAAEADPAADES